METIKPYLDALVEFLKNASPIVWESAAKQVYVQVAQDALWLLLVITLAVGGALVARYCYKKYLVERAKRDYNYDDDWSWGVFGGCALCALTTAIAFALTSNLISLLINPNFYALKILLELAGLGE